MNPETRIPFTVGELDASGQPMCDGDNREYRVSLQIFNTITQLIAVPILESSTSGGSYTGRNKLNGLLLRCGRYIAYWDGKVGDTGREASSGVYIYRLVINDQQLTKRMFVAK